MKDIVIAKGNEADFIQMAERLGYDELCFIGKADLSKLQKTTKIKLSTIKAVESSDKDRAIIEGKRAELIYDFEKKAKKDAMHYRNSGLNHVLCKLMHDKKISLGISFSTVLNSSKMQRARILGRMMQNIKLARKYKVPVVVASFASEPYQMRDAKDLAAFGRVLGLS